ncbi:MAG: helix-turn-helix domain-containing protein [Chitinophagales bacterium]|nr:helix-turn-helix domain-containing protein [Chitinophagales bacterium]
MDFLRFADAAKYLCISQSKLYKMTHRREIKYYKVGRTNVFRKEDLDEFILANSVPTAAEVRDNSLLSKQKV